MRETAARLKLKTRAAKKQKAQKNLQVGRHPPPNMQVFYLSASGVFSSTIGLTAALNIFPGRNTTTE